MPTAAGSRPACSVRRRNSAKTFERRLVRRIGVRHPAVAPFGDARQGVLVVAAVPEGDFSRGRARVDPGVVDGVVFALESHVRLRPERLHDLRLLFRATASVVEVFVEAGEFDRVPADADSQAKAAAGQNVQTGRLFRHQARSGVVRRSARRWRTSVWWSRQIDIPSRTNGSWNMSSATVRRSSVLVFVPGLEPSTWSGASRKSYPRASRFWAKSRTRDGSPPVSVKGTRAPSCILSTPYFASDSRTALILSGATAIGGMPARSSCNSEATRESRSPQPRFRASVSSISAMLVSRIGT